MFKKATIVILAILGISLYAEGKKDIEVTPETMNPPVMRVSALIGPSGLGMAKLFTDKPYISNDTLVSFEAAPAVDFLLPKLINGDIDIGILPPNVAVKLHNANPKSIVAAAVVGNAMLSLVGRDTYVTNISQLAGKTVHVAGQGSTPEFVLRTLIKSAGIIDPEITLDFSIPNTELAAALVSGKIEWAFLPEPFATVAVMNGATGERPIQRILVARDIWKAARLGDDFPMTLCVVRADYAHRYPEAVQKFLDAYRDSITWTIEHPASAAKLIEQHNLGLKAPIAEKAIPAINFDFVDAIAARPEIEALIDVFLEYAPQSVGGRLPSESFYLKPYTGK